MPSLYQAGRLSNWSNVAFAAITYPQLGHDKIRKEGEPMRTWESGLVTSFVVLGLFSGAMAQTTHNALPYPSKQTPEAIDRGTLTAESGTTPLSVTIALKLRDQNEAENLLIALHTPGNPLFYQFLTAEQFASRFAPTNADVAKVTAALSRYG